MKRLSFTLFRAMLCLCVASLPLMRVAAQTMKVYTGQVCTVYPASLTGEMPFSQNGDLLTIHGKAFSTSQVDSIIVDRSACPSSQVDVRYTGAKAWVTVAGNVAALLNVSVEGAHVSVLQDAALATEVTYSLSGQSTQGSFAMDGEYKATLLLNGLTLSNTDRAAIDIANGKRIAVKLPAGTTTTLSDGATGLQKACFFINGHAEFEGSGQLVLTGNARHAYASDEYTYFSTDFGSLTVNAAKNDGLHIGQYLDLRGGTFIVKGTGGDCFDIEKTKDPTDEDNGFVRISGGSLDLSVTTDDTKGLKNDSLFYITGGIVKANVAGNGCKGISAGWDMFINDTSGSAPSIEMTVSGTTYMPGNELLESKCRGIKGKHNLTFNGGTIRMTVTGNKAKGISLDGSWIYVKGSTNVLPS